MEAIDTMSESQAPPEIAAWMGDVDLSQIGFPLPVDKSFYTKRMEIAYKETPEGPLHLDAYRPVLPEDRRVPLVVMIHGGGWHQGGRFDMGLTRWAGYLASAELAVVSIDYRLAPATHYPDSFQDCVDAIDWAVEHAGELGADPERIGLWGDSAGAHLVLLMATSQTREGFAGPRLRAGGERLRCAVAWYPPTDLLRLHRAETSTGLDASLVQSFVGVDPTADPERWREVSPIEQAHAGTPPSLILHGTGDLLVPQVQATSFAQKLSELGAACELHVVEGAVHGFDRIAPGPEAISLIERNREFLREHLVAR
jgi:acetyl esterase/lipase